MLPIGRNGEPQEVTRINSTAQTQPQDVFNVLTAQIAKIRGVNLSIDHFEAECRSSCSGCLTKKLFITVVTAAQPTM
jgi:hypothetical protein